MKNKELKIRLSERRLNKVRAYAVYSDKTMTQVMEELIDSLPTQKVEIHHTDNNLVDQEQH